MENLDVIVRPLITEQAMHMAGKSVYSFRVATGATKFQIKQAVEKIYNVKVLDVRTANRKGKYRRRGRNYGYTGAWKKAVVSLGPEDHIDLF
jgi:large subunit ribosomal protein L23